MWSRAMRVELIGEVLDFGSEVFLIDALLISGFKGSLKLRRMTSN